MRDLSERDEIREKYADRTGFGHLVEQRMGERENAAAYGQDDRVEQLDAQLKTLGYEPGESRKKAAEERKAAAGEEKPGQAEQARKAPPAARASRPQQQGLPGFDAEAELARVFGPR